MKAMPTFPRPTTQAFFLVLLVRASSGVVALVDPEAELVDGVNTAVSVGTGAILIKMSSAEVMELRVK